MSAYHKSKMENFRITSSVVENVCSFTTNRTVIFLDPPKVVQSKWKTLLVHLISPVFIAAPESWAQDGQHIVLLCVRKNFWVRNVDKNFLSICTKPWYLISASYPQMLVLAQCRARNKFAIETRKTYIRRRYVQVVKTFYICAGWEVFAPDCIWQSVSARNPPN